MEGPTIQRRRLGLALKRARELAGKTQEEAGAVIDAAGSKVSRIELGQSGLRQTDLSVLLDYYGINGEEAQGLKQLARAGRQRGRWSIYRHAIPAHFRQYVDLEGDATEIRWYQLEIIPGLLQTQGYSRALLSLGFTGDELERQVALRLERQAILERQDGPDAAFILSESAVRRKVGNAATVRDQLQHLVEMSKWPNVTLQVLSFDTETLVEPAHGFITLRFGYPGTDVIYTEGFTTAGYLDHPDEVQAYTRLWNQLQAAALGPAESVRLIESLLNREK